MTSRLALVPAARTVRRRDAATGVPVPVFGMLAVVVGGFIFGFAIVMAGGCATGTYYRAGEGLVGSWLALITYALFSAVMKTGVLQPVAEIGEAHGLLAPLLGAAIAPTLFGIALLGAGAAVRRRKNAA